LLGTTFESAQALGVSLPKDGWLLIEHPMRFVEFFLLRMALWVGLLAALAALAIGPRRLRRGMKRAWTLARRKRLDPEEILTQVVQQHEEHVKAVRAAFNQAETAEAAIRENLRQSDEHIPTLEAEAKRLAVAGDELGARAALFKINLEQSAIENFREQLQRQSALVAESRHRLYSLELQLRQYQVGRSILLSQLAQAEKVEEQYAIVRRFDPFNAVANWQKAEGLVQEKALNARAIERVYADTSDLSGPVSSVDPAALDRQLAALRDQLLAAHGHGKERPAPSKAVGMSHDSRDFADDAPQERVDSQPSTTEKPS
jgi:phage shock protein A